MKPEKYTLLAISTTILIFSVDLIVPLGVAFGVPYIIVILIALQIPNRHATFIFAVICSLLVIIGFFFSPEGGEVWKVFLNRAIAIASVLIVALIGIAKKYAEEALLESHDKLEQRVEERTIELRTRIKELDCLHGISTLLMRPGITIPQIIEGTRELIISTVQHPEIAACSIKINDTEYSSANYMKSDWMINNDIKLNGESIGRISVCYFKEPHKSSEHTFSASEQSMINEIADRIGKSLERMQAQNKLEETYEELENTQLQLIQAEKMDSIGKLSAGIAHEVKNPLAVIQLGVNYLQKTLHDNVNIDGVIQDMENAIHRADSVIKELVDFSASRQLKLEKQDINTVIDETLLLVKHELIKYNINIIENKEKELPLVELDRIKLQQVFINLFMNAIHAMDKKGTLTINTYTSVLKEELMKHKMSKTGQHKLTNEVIVVEVTDTGSGLSEGDEGKIFEPFYTTKKAGVGTGLGLTVTENIIRLHDAFIDIKNRKEGGAIVSIIFRVF